jgi:cytochrome c-type biogenesis protein CcmE
VTPGTKKRLVFVGCWIGALGLSVGMMAWAVKDHLVYFYTPSQLSQKTFATPQFLRMGGMVKPGSIIMGHEGRVTFVLKDETHAIKVTFQGILPDLFRERQGVVVEGLYDPVDVILKAQRVLAKHDENYAPPGKKKPEGMKVQGNAG